jgi:copper chaperone CopZ
VKEHDMRDMHLLVGGMGCRRCVREVTARLRDVAGVERVIADATRSRVTLSGSMAVDDVMRALSTSTFTARIETDEPIAGTGS